MAIPIMAVLVFIFAVSIIARFMFSRLKWFYSNKMFICLLAVAIAIVDRLFPSLIATQKELFFEPRTLLLVYIPLMTMKSCYDSRRDLILKSTPYLICQAVLTVPLTAILHGFIMKWTVFSDWSTLDVMLFGMTFITMQPNCYIHLMQIHKHYLSQTIVHYDAVLSIATVLMIFDNMTIAYTMGFGVAKVFQLALIRLFAALLMGYLVGIGTRIILRYTTHEPQTYTIVILITFITVYYICFILDISAECSMITIGPIVLERDPDESDELIAILETFIFVLFFIFDSMIFLYSFYDLVVKSLYMNIAYLQVVVGSYFSFLFCRGISVLVLHCVSKIYTKDITLRTTLLIYSSTVTSNVSLIGLNTFYHQRGTHLLAKQIIPQAVFITIMTHTLHTSFFYLLMKSQIFMEHTKVQVSNKNRCLDYLAEQRHKNISMWRMNSSMTNTHWDVVEKLTAFHDQSIIKDFGDTGRLVATCPSCHTTVTAESPEATTITQEIKKRLLAEIKIITYRQSELCLISKETCRIITNHIEKVYLSNSNSFDHESFRAYFRRNARLDKAKSRYYAIFKFNPDKYHVPRKRIRKFCYRLVRITYLKLAMNVCIMISIIPIAMMLMKKKVIFLPSNLIFLCLFICEMIINILSYSHLSIREGIMAYFCSYWNIFDFIVVCLYFFEVTYELLLYSVTSLPPIPTFLRLLLTIKVFDIFKGAVPNLLNMLEQGVEARITTGYECIQVLYMSLTEVLLNLKRIIKEGGKLEECCREYLENERMEFLKLLIEIHIEVPWSVKTSKTKIMLNVLNNFQYLTIEDIKTEGFIDDFECDHLRQLVNLTEKKARIPLEEMKTDLNDILSNVQWLYTSNEALQYLSHASSTFKYKANSIICSPGDSLDGIYIIGTGVLKATYKPNDEIMKNMYNYGHVPVVDYIETGTLDREWIDILLPGNSFGEISYLTGRTNDITVECLTAVTVIFMQQRHLEIASSFSFQGIDGISQQMWKFSMMHIIAGILMNEPAYANLNKFEVLQKVSNGFVPDLSYYKYFFVIDRIEEMVLLNGQCVEYYTNELFTAPCYIPRSNIKLCFPMTEDGSSPILFIVPTTEANKFEIMDAEESIAEMHPNFKPDNMRVLKMENNKREIVKRRTTLAASVYEPGELLQRMPLGFHIGI